MMGFKDRNFTPLPSDISLEELVPRATSFRRGFGWPPLYR